MSNLSILVLGDGKHEVGPAGKLKDSAGFWALPTLVKRLLDEAPNVKYEFGLFPKMGHVRGLGDGYAKKIRYTIEVARERGFHAVVVVIDRDRRRNAETIQPLRRGRDEMPGIQFPACAVGMAVEAFDAWMIADGRAIGQAGGDAARSYPQPEKLDGEENSGNHPKDKAHELFPGDALSEKYRLVARHLRLDVLEKCCPEGFKPFADEVRERILPLVTPTGKS